MLGRIEGRRRRGQQDEMVGCHHRLDQREFKQALGVCDGQGGLACCSPWGHKESDMTERLNWNIPLYIYATSSLSIHLWMDKEVQEEGDICIHRADSLCCIAFKATMLQKTNKQTKSKTTQINKFCLKIHILLVEPFDRSDGSPCLILLPSFLPQVSPPETSCACKGASF